MFDTPRFEIRLTREQAEMIAEEALISNLSIEEFIVRHAMYGAQALRDTREAAGAAIDDLIQMEKDWIYPDEHNPS